jgi:hypothetical protein
MWQKYLKARLVETADKNEEISVIPHMIDGISYPMSIVHVLKDVLIKELLEGDEDAEKELKVIIMGATEKSKSLNPSLLNQNISLKHIFS